ncbi:MAG: hypothetical protein HY795_15195 [Desulfovibrio sp.]|nr:hypothetical protein [Desulfovibrio sp.]MBI4960638.1 hypothetical protein [Desulfovibrio sp.]
MAEKKVILLVAGKVNTDGDGASWKKFQKKAVVVTNYTAGDAAAFAAKVPGGVKTTADALAATFEGDTAFAYVAAGDLDAAALEDIMGKILAAADRRTLVVLAAANTLMFYGLGTNSKTASIDRAAKVEDIVPTAAYIADLPLPDDTTGAVLYQVLKETNLKLNEFLKLKEALTRMEAALQRDSREPWDKHDCA